MFNVEILDAGAHLQARLVDGWTNSHATIYPNMGFNCASFVCRIGGRDLDFLYAGDDFPGPGVKPARHGTPILAPFPNRIRGGMFRFDGREFQLPRNEEGKNAIHGLALDQPWRIVATGANDKQGAFVRGEFQLSQSRADWRNLWPADFKLMFTYRLAGHTLETTIEVENPDSRPLPFGVGTHPYFRFPLERNGSLADCEIVSPGARQVELIECLPTGKSVPVEPEADLRHGIRFDRRAFDDVYTDLQSNANGLVTHRLIDHQARAAFELAHSPDFQFAVVFTPPHRKAICIEPYTCVTDAINLEGSGMATGLWVLAPGEKRRLRIEYRAMTAN